MACGRDKNDHEGTNSPKDAIRTQAGPETTLTAASDLICALHQRTQPQETFRGRRSKNFLISASVPYAEIRYLPETARHNPHSCRPSYNPTRPILHGRVSSWQLAQRGVQKQLVAEMLFPSPCYGPKCKRSGAEATAVTRHKKTCPLCFAAPSASSSSETSQLPSPPTTAAARILVGKVPTTT